jgi:hypothetical protein
VSAQEPREPGDNPMTGRYVLVLVVEAIVLALLWILGRVYA